MESSETLKTRAVFVRPGYWVFTRRPRRKDRDVYNERKKTRREQLKHTLLLISKHKTFPNLNLTFLNDFAWMSARFFDGLCQVAHIDPTTSWSKPLHHFTQSATN